MPKTQTTPRLTVYRTGLINLNGEATRLMHTHHVDVDLLPPIRERDAWQLDRRRGSGALLAGGHGRGILRFRAPARVEQLFAQHPPAVVRLCFELCPAREGLDLYELRTVQQNLFS